MTRRIKQLTLDVFPSPEVYYKENTIEYIVDLVREFKKEAEKRGVPISSALKKGDLFLTLHLYDTFSKVLNPKNRTPKTLSEYYTVMALKLYEDFMQKTGKTDTESFREYIKKNAPMVIDPTVLKEIENLKKGLPVPKKYLPEKVLKKIYSWKLDLFSNSYLLGIRKYIKHLSKEIEWRKQAIQKTEKEIKALKNNKSLMKIIREKNWLDKELVNLRKIRPKNSKEQKALELAILIKNRQKFLETMKNILSQQKTKLEKYRKTIESMKVYGFEKHIRKKKPFVEIQEELYKSRKKIAPLLTLHRFSRKKR